MGIIFLQLVEKWDGIIVFRPTGFRIARHRILLPQERVEKGLQLDHNDIRLRTGRDRICIFRNQLLRLNHLDRLRTIVLRLGDSRVEHGIGKAVGEPVR